MCKIDCFHIASTFGSTLVANTCADGVQYPVAGDKDEPWIQALQKLMVVRSKL